MAKRDKTISEGRDAEAVPQLSLTHGQTLWLLAELGLRQGVKAKTFNSYIKSLRKIGIPFEPGNLASGRRHVTYNYEELMELTLALLLRVYNWLPDSVASGLRSFRDELQPIYRQAYRDTLKRAYPMAWLSADDNGRLPVGGLFLDLNIRYAAGHMIKFGPPRTLSPFEAMSGYAHSQAPARAYLPLNMSAVAEMIVDGARAAPTIRRGRSAYRRNEPASAKD